MNCDNFLTDLHQKVEAIISIAKQFQSHTQEQLSKKDNPESWSVLECLAHLNLYADYYLLAIEQKMSASNLASNTTRSATWLGRKSIESVHPNNRKPQKAIKRLNPTFSTCPPSTLSDFLKHQEHLVKLLEAAKNKNLDKVKIPIEFFKLLKLNLGDCLEFVVVHQQRHIAQAQRALA